MEKLGYRPGLDGLRAVAVAGVVWTHLLPGAMNQAGNVGVTVFFVLSGFLITRLLLEERDRGGIDLRGFWVRRARRLLPALPPVVIVGLAVNASIGSPLGWPLVGALTYSSNWFRAAGVDQGALGHFWSLAVEEQFYLLWPVVVLAAGSPRRVARVALAAAGLVLAARLLTSDPAVAYHATHTRADALMIGAVAACLPLWRPSRLTVAAASVLLIGACSGQVVDLTMGWGLTLIAVAAVLINEAALTWKPPPVLVQLGKWSYGIYLWNGVLAVAAHGQPTAMRVGAAGLSVGLAALSARILEPYGAATTVMIRGPASPSVAAPNLV